MQQDFKQFESERSSTIKQSSVHRSAKSTKRFIQSPIPKRNRRRTHTQTLHTVPNRPDSPTPHRSHHLVPVVPVAGGARDEQGPLRDHLVLPLLRRGRSSSSRSVNPLLRRHPYQRLAPPFGPIRGRGSHRQEGEEEPAQPRSSHRRSRGWVWRREREVSRCDRVMAVRCRDRGLLLTTRAGVSCGHMAREASRRAAPWCGLDGSSAPPPCRGGARARCVGTRIRFLSFRCKTGPSVSAPVKHRTALTAWSSSAFCTATKGKGETDAFLATSGRKKGVALQKLAG
jgi:hypothetical protein